MNFAGLLFLLITHFITGRGVIELFKVKLPLLVIIPLSFIMGVGIVSFLPFILALLHLPISKEVLVTVILSATVLAGIPLLKYFKGSNMSLSLQSVKWPKIYELPFLFVFFALLSLSVWRCFYYAPNPRDMLAGPEAIAEFAVREKTMVNSIFSVDLSTTNNQLKPLFIASLQVIYKIFVQPFGQTWLSIIVLSFITLVISILKQKLHPVIVGFIMVYFFGMPEVFGYTYLLLFDYSNMIYFFCGFYFLSLYLSDLERKNYFLLSILFFSIASYVRSETPILIAMATPLLLFYFLKDKMEMKKIVINTALFLIFPFAVYYLAIGVYDKYYLPQHYDVATEINKHISDVSIFFKIMGDMSTELIFSDNGALYYGYFVQLFMLILIIDLIFYRKNSSREKIVALYGICVVYVGLAALSYIFPLVDLMHTIKRGLFKMFPLMLLYFRNSGILLKLTDILNKWEYGIKDEAPRPKVVPVGNKPPVNMNKKK